MSKKKFENTAATMREYFKAFEKFHNSPQECLVAEMKDRFDILREKEQEVREAFAEDTLDINDPASAKLISLGDEWFLNLLIEQGPQGDFQVELKKHIVSAHSRLHRYFSYPKLREICISEIKKS